MQQHGPAWRGCVGLHAAALAVYVHSLPSDHKPLPPAHPHAHVLQVYQTVVQQLGPDHPEYIDAVVALAEQHRELGQSADAERCVASAGTLPTVSHICLGVRSGSSSSGSMGAGTAVSLTACRFPQRPCTHQTSRMPPSPPPLQRS